MSLSSLLTSLTSRLVSGAGKVFELALRPYAHNGWLCDGESVEVSPYFVTAASKLHSLLQTIGTGLVQPLQRGVIEALVHRIDGVFINTVFMAQPRLREDEISQVLFDIRTAVLPLFKARTESTMRL